MYKAFIGDEVLECECFKTLYNAALLLVKNYLEEDVLHTARIEVDGEEKYQVTPTIWYIDGKMECKSIETVRLEDWACVSVRSLPGINQRARWCVRRYLDMCTEPPEKKELEDLIHRVANRFAETRKDYDRISEELNKYILSVV